MPSVRDNARLWGDTYQWSRDGDEWVAFADADGVAYDDWKRSVLDHLVRPFVAPAHAVLEVGCGHGRWSEHLAPLCRRLVCLDLVADCLERTRSRLRHLNLSGEEPTFIQTGGPMPQVADGSIDLAWSFDVFVHMDSADVAQYLREFRRVLKAGGAALVHHSDDNRWGGWRSAVTAAEFRRLARSAGLVVTRQFDCWGDRCQYSVKRHQDVISLVGKPKT